jgi:hypothetical protein
MAEENGVLSSWQMESLNINRYFEDNDCLVSWSTIRLLRAL